MEPDASDRRRGTGDDSSAPSTARGEATPRVSILLPTCDRRDQTRRCVESLLEQDFGDFEIVLVDGTTTKLVRRDFASSGLLEATAFAVS